MDLLITFGLYMCYLLFILLNNCCHGGDIYDHLSSHGLYQKEEEVDALIAGSSVPRYTPPAEQLLMEHLMEDYSSLARPVTNSNRSVEMTLGLTMAQIMDIDEKNQVLVSNVYLDQYWFDEYLQWNPSNFSGLQNLRIPPYKVWKPDIVLYNNADDFSDNKMPALAMVKPDGSVFWPVPCKLRSSCKVDVTYFPFDEQQCSIKLGSWTYNGNQVNLKLHGDNMNMKQYVINGEWKLLQTTAVRNVKVYPCCPEPFPDVVFSVYLRRRTLYYMYNVIYPCLMMSTLTLLVFCLPPESGEKVTLGITVLLAFSVLMISIAEKMPETSESVPIISVYLSVVMAMTSLSVILAVFVLNLHHRGPNLTPVPAYLRRCIQIKSRSSPQQQNTTTNTTTNTTNNNHRLRLPPLVSQRRRLSSIATGPHTDHPDWDPSEYQTEVVRNLSVQFTLNSLLTEAEHFADAKRKQAGNSPSGEANPETEADNCRRSNHQHQEILKVLNKLVLRQEEEENETEIVREWRHLAQFVDRVLFWIYLVVSLGSTLFILVVIPYFRIIPLKSPNNETVLF